MSELPVVPEWEPVLGAALGIAAARPDARAAGAARSTTPGCSRCGCRPNWPPDSELAMLVATYAKHVGRAVAYSLAAFRQAFAGGRDLGEEGTVLIAGAACEMHPTALLKAVTLRSVTSGLRDRQRSGPRRRRVGAAGDPDRRPGVLRRRRAGAGDVTADGDGGRRALAAPAGAGDEGQPRLSPDRHA